MKYSTLKNLSVIILLIGGIFSFPSNAQIVYTDVNPDATSSGTYNLDLNNDGTTDFVIKHTSGSGTSSNTCSGTKTNHYIKISPSNNRQVADYNGNNATKMVPNAGINASTLTWSSHNNQVMISYDRWECLCGYYGCYWSASTGGQWYGADDGFLGLRIISGTHSYYGWVQINISADGSTFTIKDYAYNSAPDQGIFAGQSSAEYLGILTITNPNYYFCAGSNVNIPYIIAGTFSASNIVTAELSDATGSFASPVAMGSVVSNVSGNINAVIPGLTPSGNAYRIRVTSSNPARTSYANGSNIAITNGGLPIGTITAYETNICAGPVYLTASEGSCYSYQWQLNGNVISGAISSYYNPEVAGNYTCFITTGAGSVTSNIITVTANPAPAEILALGETTVCSGSVGLYNNNPSGYTFQWKLNGNDILNATSYSYSASATGDYTCVKTNLCGSVASNTISVSINPDMAAATITAVGATTLCSGPLILNANTGLGLSYQWYYSPIDYNGAIIPGATSSSYAAGVSGYYYVIETNSFGCTRNSNIIITAIGTPVATLGLSWSYTICKGNPVVLYAAAPPYNASYSYQWIKDGVDIPGATSGGYTVNHPGTYSVRVYIASGGCSSTSAAVQVTHCSNNNKSANSNSSQKEISSLPENFQSLSVAPNPVSGSTKISFTLNKSEKVSLRIYDMNGRLIKTLADREFTSGSHLVEWDATITVAGIYFLRMATESSVQTKELIVVK